MPGAVIVRVSVSGAGMPGVSVSRPVVSRGMVAGRRRLAVAGVLRVARKVPVPGGRMSGPVGRAMPVPRREMAVPGIRVGVESLVSVSVPMIAVAGPVDEPHRSHHDQPEETCSEEHRINQRNHPLRTVPKAFGAQLLNGASGHRYAAVAVRTPGGGFDAGGG